MTATLIAFCGPVLLVLLLARLYKIDPHPGAVGLFIGGGAAAFLAMILEKVGFAELGLSGDVVSLSSMLGLLVIAFVEELVKISLIIGQTLPEEARTWRRFALGSIWVGAGFAAAENAVYVQQFGANIVLLRMLTAVPLHLATALIAARLIWFATEYRRAELVPSAFLAVMLLHGWYDYLAIPAETLPALLVITVVMCGVLILDLLAKADAPATAPPLVGG